MVFNDDNPPPHLQPFYGMTSSPYVLTSGANPLTLHKCSRCLKEFTASQLYYHTRHAQRWGPRKANEPAWKYEGKCVMPSSPNAHS